MTNNIVRTLGILAVCLILGLSVQGCKKGGADLNDDMTSSSDRSTFETTTIDGLPEISEDTLFSPDRGLKLVYFDFDSYDLRPDARATLTENAELIKQVPGVIIQIEGHCDERGTQEYNLALGERRALATREHLISLGVSGDRIVTISYGEEDPADPGSTEAAWAQNRRCEFNRAL